MYTIETLTGEFFYEGTSGECELLVDAASGRSSVVVGVWTEREREREEGRGM